MKGILINENNDASVEAVRSSGLIVSGLIVGDINYQRCRVIIDIQKGEIKNSPTLGFGIDNYLKSVRNKQQFVTELTKELKSDGISATIRTGDDLSTFDIDL